MSLLDRAVRELLAGNCTEFRRLLAEYARRYAPLHTITTELPPMPVFISNGLKCLDEHRTYIDVYVEADVPMMNGYFLGQERSVYVETKDLGEALSLISALSSGKELCVPYKSRVTAKEFAEALEKRQGCSELPAADVRVDGLLARFEGYAYVGRVQFKFVSQLAKKTRTDQQTLSRLYRELSILDPTIRLIVSVVQW